MKQYLMVFGLAYASGVGTVLLVEHNSSRIPVCELPIPAFEKPTIVTLGAPKWFPECVSETTGANRPLCVTDCESESAYLESDSTDDNVIYVPSGSALSIDFTEDAPAKHPETSKSDNEDSKPYSPKDEKDCN